MEQYNANEADTINGTDDNPNGHFSWLGFGDWICTPPAPQGPDLLALKHDMAYASPQKFEGVNLIDPDTEREIGDTEELDITWNPRNKYLADD